jgi:lipopolysaccharide export LptBFGC system permease protein LptF
MVKIIRPVGLLIIPAFFLMPISQASSVTIVPKAQYETKNEIAAKNNSLKLNNTFKLAQATTLRNANISFHTNNEDKDSDTHVTVVVKDRDNRVVARLSNDLGHFDDNSDAGPYALRVLNTSDIESIQQGSVTIRIDPNGHDTWRFNFFLDLQFADGKHLSGGADGLEMSHNRRQQTFGTEGILSSR